MKLSELIVNNIYRINTLSHKNHYILIIDEIKYIMKKIKFVQCLFCGINSKPKFIYLSDDIEYDIQKIDEKESKEIKKKFDKHLTKEMLKK